MQCNAFLSKGVLLKVFANRTIKDKKSFILSLSEVYGVVFSNSNLVTFHTKINKLINLRIAIMGVCYLLLRKMPEYVISRNLYYSFIHAVIFRKPLIFETHQIEFGFRKLLQRWIMTRDWVNTVVISNMLLEVLRKEHSIIPFKSFVFPDAAPAGLKPASDINRIEKLHLSYNLRKKIG